MPRLTEGVKHQIVALREAGLSWNMICKQLRVAQSTARCVVAKKETTGSVTNKPVVGRPRKMTAKCERVLSRIIRRNRRSSLTEITHMYNSGRQGSACVSRTTLKRALHRLGFYGRKAAKKLDISPRNRLQRLRWCKSRISYSITDWSRIIFSDEVRFGFRPDGGVIVWRTLGERFSPGCTTAISTSRSSIMFWGCISYEGVGLLLPCSNRMTSYEYISVMSAAAINSLPSFNLIYMDDNAPIHRSILVRLWKQEHGIETLQWPPYSPDLNPIENVWAFLKRQLNKSNNPPVNLDELRSCVCVMCV
jgi:transposase